MVGSRPEIGSIRITANPARTEATIQLIEPMRSGEIPTRSAPFSLPAAARVANPKRVKRNTAVSTTVATTTSPASSRRFALTVVPSRCTGVSASTPRFTCTAAPVTGNRSRTISWR